MTRHLFLIIGALFIVLNSYSQTDTTIVKGKRGFLFLSAHNYMYDYPIEYPRSLGFHDFFFPADTVNFRLLTSKDTTINIKDGLRVDYFSLREQYKYGATAIACKDTSHCYYFPKFYVIPVVIDYKKFEDYEPFECRRNYFELEVGIGNLRFDYLHKGIIITRINYQAHMRKK